MAKRQQTKFVQSATCSTLINSPATETTVSFTTQRRHIQPANPFARLLPLMGVGPPAVGTLLPFARIARAAVNDESIFSGMAPDNLEEQEGASRRGHNNEWYQERCVFCAECKTSINSTYQKKGSRCHGCRRWFHHTCIPPGNSSSCKSNSRQRTQQGTTTAAMATGEPTESSSRAAGDSHGLTTSLFFHTDSCKQLYNKLAAVTAAGEQQLPLPSQRLSLPWQRQQQPPAQQTWQLLDLAEVRHLYKDAQRRGVLHKQLTQVQHMLKDFAEASRDTSKAAKGSSEHSSSRHGVRTRLGSFLTVCEVVKSLGDSPKDLLEDSYALITRTDRGAPLCAGTLNVFGCDHARLQGLVTPQHLQRQGHASRMVKQLEAVLQGAGVQQLVVILEPQDSERSNNDGRIPTSAVEHWFRKVLGYHAVGSELHMLWRRELPEYHKNLIAGCTLLVKPLSLQQKRWWW